MEAVKGRIEERLIYENLAAGQDHLLDLGRQIMDDPLDVGY
jgi:hypothetical protein